MNERVVARGKIRVDARRALGKLREHLLVDLDLYLAEIVRAATLGGASEVKLHWDADDVIASFDGAPLPPESLERLLDHLTGDGGDRRLRLLALGVNAALGTEPERIDVYALDGESSERVRFEPALFEREDGRPERTRAAPPAGAPARGIAVHVRKRLGWSVMRRALSAAIHREVELLSDLLGEAAIAVRAGSQRLASRARARALVRAPFEVYGARSAAVELLAEPVAPIVELSELGVVLARASWSPAPGFSGIAARLVLNADELPTNASRSAVREDSRLLKDSMAGAERALFDAVGALAARVTERPAPPGVDISDASAEELEQALGRIVAAVAAEEREGGAPCPEARALFELPLLWDATGRRRAVSSFRHMPRVWAHTGEEPLPEELAPWLDSVLWLRGHGAERALAAAQLADAAELVELAKAGAERRRRFLAHPEGEPAVPRSELEIARKRFEQGDLRGEVAVLTPDAKRSQVRVFVERRHFASFELPNDEVPLPMVLAIASNELHPSFDWSSVEPEAALRHAVGRGLLEGVSAVLPLEKRLPSLAPRERAALAAVLRCACGVLAAVPGRFGLADSAAPSALRRGLDALAIWPTTSGRLAPITEIAPHVARTGAICFVRPGTKSGVAADGRPVLAATRDEVQWLAGVIGGEIELVPYERGLLPAAGKRPHAHDVALRAAFDAEQARLVPEGERAEPRALELGGARVLAAVAPSSSVVELHAGVVLGAMPRPAMLGDLLVAIDDPRSVPNAAWSGIHHRSARFWWKLERELLEERLAAGQAITPALRVHLLQAAARLTARVAQAEAARGARGREHEERRSLLEKLRALPLIPVLHGGGAVRLLSLAAVEALHPVDGPLPLLDAPVDFETFDWHPVVLSSESEREALQKIFPKLALASMELEARRQQAQEHAARVQFEALPELDPRQVAAADSEWPTLVVEALDARVVSIAAGLPRRGIAAGDAIELLLSNRRLAAPTSFAGPLIAARVALRESGIVAYREIADSARPSIESALERAGRALLEALVEHAATHGRSAELLSDPRAQALFLHFAPGASAELRAQLERLAWPTVQGDDIQGRALVSDGTQVRFGRQRPAAWIPRPEGRSELDDPVLHLPAGSALETLLQRLGYSLTDVTTAVEKLQARRARAENAPPPRLAGEPAHPALRFSLAAIGVTRAEGEVEIAPGPASEVTLFDLDGVAHAIDAKVPIAIRMVARTELVGREARAVKALLRETASALARELLRLSARFSELPDFVAEHARRLVITRVESDAILPAAYAKMPAFSDVRGARYSLEALRAAGEWRFTELAPPYPDRAYDPPILRLERAEAKTLAKVAKFRRASSMLQRDLEAERRRSAAPLEAIALSAEIRARCLVVTALATGEGEAGVLLPHAVAERGIELCVGRRRLGRLEDGEGWPLVAIVNDDSLKPNRWFDGPQRKSERKLVTTRVRQAAMVALAEHWLRLAGARPSERVDAELRVSGAKLRVLGMLWLSPDPASPRVRVHLPNAPLPLEGALAAPPVHPAASGGLPLDGELLLAVESGSPPPVDAVLAGLGKLALEAATAICAAAPESELERWMLALCGAASALTAPTASGATVDRAAVLAEIRRAGKLWVSSSRGSAEGEFPAGAPPFVLAAGSPLVRALELRAPGLLAELGGVEAAPHEQDEPEHAVLAFREVVEQPVVAPSAPAKRGGFFASLRAMLGLGGREEPLADPLADALLAALEELELDGDPVLSVERRKSGRAFRYQAAERRIQLGTGDPRIARIAKRALGDRHALDVLVAAAVSEINRALVQVTDAEEQRVLLELLQRASR